MEAATPRSNTQRATKHTTSGTWDITSTIKYPRDSAVTPDSLFQWLQESNGSDVASVTISKDGHRLATSHARNYTVQMWNFSSFSSRNVQRLLRGHTAKISSLDFSPDGRFLATGSFDTTAKVWDTQTGSSIATLSGHRGNVLSVQFVLSPSLRPRLLTGSVDRKIRLWEVYTGSVLRTFRAGHSILALAVSANCQCPFFATGSNDGTAQLWDLTDRHPPHFMIRTFRGHTRPVNAVALTSAMHLLVTGSDDFSAKLWDVARGTLLQTFRDTTKGALFPSCLSVVISPDDRFLYASFGKVVKAWDLEGIFQERGRLFSGHSLQVQSMAVFPKAPYLVTCCGEGTAKVWSVLTGKQVRRCRPAHVPLSIIVRSLTGAPTRSDFVGRLMTGEAFTVEVMPYSNVVDIKRAIYKNQVQEITMLSKPTAALTPPDYQRLFYGRNQLEDNQRIKECGIVRSGEAVYLVNYRLCKHPKPPGCSIPQAELRGITLRQLKDVMMHILTHCEEDGWESSSTKKRLRPEEVTLYDLVDCFVKPTTERRKCSYVEMVAHGPQHPLWFVSHWWGESVFKFVASIEQHAYDRGLGDDTPYWVCAYAMNQHDVNSEVGKDPLQSPFYKAMHLTVGTVSVLDGDCECFKRVWCSYEISIAFRRSTELKQLDKKRYLYDVYTKSVGITDGIATIDTKKYRDDGVLVYVDSKSVHATARERRQSFFPLEVSQKALEISLEQAKSSREEDRRRILNCICGQTRDMNAPPPSSHPAYNAVNALLHGMFAANTYSLAVDSLDDYGMGKYRKAMSASSLLHWNISFGLCKNFRKEARSFFSESLPTSLQVLELDIRDGDFESPDEFAVGLGRLSQLTTFRLRHQCDSGSMPPTNRLWDELGMLNHLQHLVLDFSFYRPESQSTLAVGLGTLLANTSSLRELNLKFHGCKGISLAIQDLADGLASLDHLTTLDLDFANSDVGFDTVFIWQALGSLTHLRSLSLSHRESGKPSCVKGVGKSISAMPELQTLKLDFLNLRERKATELANGISASRNLSTVHLCFESSLFLDKTICTLCAALMMNSVEFLKDLKLSFGGGFGGQGPSGPILTNLLDTVDNENDLRSVLCSGKLQF